MGFGEPRPLCSEMLALRRGVVKTRGVLLVLIVPSCIELDATILCLSRNDARISRIQLGWLHTEASLQLLERSKQHSERGCCSGAVRY